MMITNYEEHQQQAVQAGAVRGFGKLTLRKPTRWIASAPLLD